MTTTSKLVPQGSHGTPPDSHRSRVAFSSKPEKYAANPSGVVVGLTLDMAWQLAIVVLTPILLGHIADSKFHTNRILTCVGLVLAITGMVVVVRRTLQKLAEYTTDSTQTKEQPK